jgi:hypothetical protein
MVVLAALLLQKGWCNVDTAGKGHREGQHGNTMLYRGTKLNNNFFLCNFLINTAPFTPPSCYLMHTFEAMIGAKELASGPDVDGNAGIMVNGFSMEWYRREVGLDFCQQSGGENKN